MDAFLPFPDCGPLIVAGVYAAHFLGFFIRGAFGFGSNMPIVLLTTWLLGPHHAILLVVLTATLAQAHLFPQGLRGPADWGVIRPLLIGTLAGIALGTWVFTGVAAPALTLILGALVCAIVLMDRFRAMDMLARVVDMRGRILNFMLAIVSGTIGTVSGGGGIYFLVGFLKQACPEPAVFRATNIIFSGLFMFGRVIFVALWGLLSPNLFVEALLLVPAIFLGTWAGTRFFGSRGTEGFFKALQILLVAAALALIGKGLAGLAGL